MHLSHKNLFDPQLILILARDNSFDIIEINSYFMSSKKKNLDAFNSIASSIEAFLHDLTPKQRKAAIDQFQIAMIGLSSPKLNILTLEDRLKRLFSKPPTNSADSQKLLIDILNQLPVDPNGSPLLPNKKSIIQFWADTDHTTDEGAWALECVSALLATNKSVSQADLESLMFNLHDRSIPSAAFSTALLSNTPWLSLQKSGANLGQILGFTLNCNNTAREQLDTARGVLAFAKAGCSLSQIDSELRKPHAFYSIQTLI